MIHSGLVRTASLWGLVLLSIVPISYGQAPHSGNSAGIIYQYPIPSAVDVLPETKIGIRAASEFDPESLNLSSTARGSRTGLHMLKGHLSSNRRMVIFQPDKPFAYDEHVDVQLAATLLTEEEVSDNFSFQTSKKPLSAERLQQSIANASEISTTGDPKRGDARPLDSDTLPLTVTVDNGATPGVILIANQGWLPMPRGSFLAMLDEHGRVLHDSDLGRSSAMDFKRQPNGMMTYYDNYGTKFYGLDSSWNLVDSFAVVRDYLPDGHELRVLPDGSSALLGATEDSRNIQQYITGGNTDANIRGSLIQEFDKDGNCIFQWRGIDHYSIFDAVHVNFLAASIDFQHANSIEFEHPNASSIDSAGDIILSNRHLCEITKINNRTGNIIWRFGGAHNQFRLIGDSIWFSWQHDVRLLPNGHITMFDNANYDSVAGRPGEFMHHSRALEYELDTVAMTATLVWQFHHNPETYSDAMGSVERLPNGNTFIGWGNDTLAMTEVDRNNRTVFEARLPQGSFSYRAVKYPTDTAWLPSSVKKQTGSTGGMSLDIYRVDGSFASARIQLDVPSTISLEIYDILGHKVRTVLSGEFKSAGSYETPLDFRGLAKGGYWCVLRSGEQVVVCIRALD